MHDEDDSSPAGDDTFDFLSTAPGGEDHEVIDHKPANGLAAADPTLEQKTLQHSGESGEPSASRAASVRQTSRVNAGLVGYCAVVTCLLLWLFLTGRVKLTPEHPLESLPDLRPLQENEFRSVPPEAELPDGHTLDLGDSRRFGDVLLTPQRVTREPVQFAGFMSGDVDETLDSPPVLKLWLQFENVADDYAFPPLDTGLVSARMPRDGRDEATLANSYLLCSEPGGGMPERTLNFLHLPESNFRMVGQNAGNVILPAESVTTYLASAEVPDALDAGPDSECIWRVHFRKGVSAAGNGVTTLVDVRFRSTQIEDAELREP